MSILFRARRIFAGLIAVITMSLAAPAAVVAGVNLWTASGPDGGWVRGVAWHPAREGILFAAAGRVYRSVDNGAHWTSVSTGLSAQGRFVFDPANGDRILVSGSPVRRSTDGGASFVAAAPLPDASAVSHLAITADGSAVYGTSGGRVFRTGDFAQTWQEVSSGLPGGLQDFATGLRVSPSDPNTVYASFANGILYRTTNSGSSWTAISTGLRLQAINPGNASQLLAVSGSSLLRSTDGGVSWSTVAFGFFNLVEFDPLVVNRVIAYDNFNARLFVSTDAGGVWSAAGTIPSVQADALSISSTTAGKLALGTAEGVYVSTDVAQTLQFRSTGIQASDLRSITVSRAAPFRIYASFLGGPNGVFLRTGTNWLPTNVAGLSSVVPPRSVITGLATDPDNSSVVYAGTYGALAKTLDAGSTWSLPGSYFSAAQPYSLVVDPANTQVLYVATGTLGIARSADGGSTWSPRNGGLPLAGADVPVEYVTIDPADSQRLYAIPLNTGALYRTVNAGLGWSRVAGGLLNNDTVRAVAFDPFDPARVYAGTDSGLYRSIDRGDTWTLVPTPGSGRSVSQILFDAGAPGTFVLVSSNIVPVIRTVDNGATWEGLPWDTNPEEMFPPRGGVLDPSSPGNIIVGASSRGLRQLQIAPDLSVSISGIPAQVALQSTPTLRLAVQNRASSPFATARAQVSIALPAMMSPGTVSTTRGSCIRAAQTIHCDLGALKVGDLAQVDVPLSVTAGSGTITATVQPHEAELAPGDNTAASAVVVQAIADTRATLNVPASINRGAVATIQGQISNIGPNTANNARLTMVLPAGLTPASGSGSNGTCTVSGLSVTCTVPSLAAGAAATFTVQATAASLGVQSLSASSGSDEFDIDSANNLASATVGVKPVSDLGITLGNVSTSLTTGQSAAATVTITNAGSDPVGVAVATISGNGVSLTTATPNGGSCSIAGPTASCSLGAVGAGATRTIEISFSATTAGAAQLNASVDSEAADPSTSNNSASSSISITAPPSGGGGGTGSGGGGAVDGLGLLALLTLLVGRLPRVRNQVRFIEGGAMDALAQESRSVTVRLKTGAPAVESTRSATK